METLRSLQNANGGGLSTSFSGKYTSVRHELARAEGKLTAGEAAKLLTKALGVTILARDIKEYAQEWHHSGFYKSGRGKRKIMGRTFFFTPDEVQELIDNWDQLQAEKTAKIVEQKLENERLKAMKIYGFSYIWVSNPYSRGQCKKTIFIVGDGYVLGSANFTQISEEEFEAYKHNDGKLYYGWDEPSLASMQSLATKQAAYKEIKRQERNRKARERYAARKHKEAKTKRRIEVMNNYQENINNPQAVLSSFFQNEIHPAPSAVQILKNESGLSWSKLRELYKSI